MDAAPGAAEGGMSMGVYIKGMEMPTDRSRWVVIYPDGKVEFSDKTDEWETLDKGAVQVPPHGRLIDADALDADLEWQDMHTGEWDAVGFSIEEIENAPTIIPAEPAEESE